MSARRAPLRVLVVEDEPLVAEAHRAFVERVPGFRAAGAVHSGREALAAVGRGGVDLVLLDMGLPDTDGLTVLRALRAAGAPVDVIAVTAARELPVVRGAVSLGVVHYLLKPFTAAALREKLQTYARFREQVGGADGPGVLGQSQIDAALAHLRPAGEGPARGISAATLGVVATALRAVLRSAPGGGAAGASAAEVAAEAGISRESARRYLEHLVAAGSLDRVPRYGGPGRPEVGYLPRGEP